MIQTEQAPIIDVRESFPAAKNPRPSPVVEAPPYKDFNTIPVSDGLLDPRHSTLIACPLGLFLLLIDWTTVENENGEGVVLGGTPIKYEELAEVLGADPRRVRRWAKKLEDDKYIRTENTNQYGILRWWVGKNKKLGVRRKKSKSGAESVS